MKILYSHRTQSADGQYVHIESLTRALVDEGHDVLISGPEGVGHPNDVRRSLDIDTTAKKSPLKRLPFGAYEFAERAYSEVGYRQLQRAVETFRPDIIYERYNLHYHAGRKLAEKLGIPFILEVNSPLADERKRHGDLVWQRWADEAERTIWQSADLILPVTNVLGRILTSKGVDPARIRMVPNGVDDHTLELADPLPIREKFGFGQAVVLGFVGFVRDWHGVDKIVDWMATPAAGGCHLLIIGDGPIVPSLKDQAAALGISDRLIVTGVVQREDIASHIAACDVALQPASTPYASPLKLQEYMAQARAIIAPAQPNIEETVTDGQTALLFTPEDSNSLQKAMEELVSDRQLRAQLGNAARQALLDSDMTWRENARRIVEFAEKVLSGD